MASSLDSFLATMVTDSRVPLARAVALARECYGFEAQAIPLTGERDENFKLCVADHGAYVLKIANAAEEQAVGDLLTAALRHVERSDPSFPCPRVVPERGGGSCVRFLDEGGVERTARVLTYLPGRLLASTARSRAQRAACGRIAGRLANALRGFDHPAAHRAIIWDLRHVSQVHGLLGQLRECPYRQAAALLLERVVPQIEARFPRLRQQVVHNDLNPLNILVSPTDEACVTGVIDFGDLTYTALIADVAVTAAELLSDECRATTSACESIREVAGAYHESLPLQPQERAALAPLVAARLVTNLIVQEWHRHRNPAGGHYAALDPGFVAARLEIARGLLQQEGPL